MLCSGIVTQLHGVVCANFGFQRGVSPGACKGAWHGACYQQSDKDNFPVFNQEIEAEDLVSDDKMEEEDPKRFKKARDGDHLMTSFQCDLCHFENCKRRCPIPDNMQDEVALLGIRRANLDALWSRERSTVRSNRLQGKHWVSASESAGWSDHALPKRGPFPVEDVFGMQAAVNMLLRSRDVGINSKTIQYETMRKLRSFLSNFVHTTYGGHGDTFMSEDGGGGTVSMSPTNSPWFKRFMRGVHKRMGDVWIPDRALMKRKLMLCLTLLEEDWLVYSEGNDGGGKLKAGLTATMLIAGWFAALRGEEIVRIDVGQMRQHWDESVNHTEEPHVPLMLSGRFKREIGEKVFCQPLAITSNSGVNIGEWMWRTLETLGQQNVLSGPMFRVAGKGKGVYKRATTADLNPSFINILARVQKRWANAFAGDLDIEKEFSIGRSLRRGVTSEAQNMGIPREVIEANNRWRRQARAKGLTPGMSMMERYSDAKASVPTLVRFSKEL